MNFKKNERKYEPNNSEVLRMVQEVDQEPRDAEPEGKLAEFEYKENLRNIRNGAIQSHTFKKLQAALEEDKGRKIFENHSLFSKIHIFHSVIYFVHIHDLSCVKFEK